MRGKGLVRAAITVRLGITPAHAGKSPCYRSGRRHKRGHPRACGEKRKTLSPLLPVPGSPPRVRGKGCAHRSGARPYGITPACAGKRPTVRRITALVGDHPRVCGEKVKNESSSLRRHVSPPRVRGKGLPFCGFCILCRITPACAGKSDVTEMYSISQGDHPRVCGEKQT